MLNKRGGIEADLTVSRLVDDKVLHDLCKTFTRFLEVFLLLQEFYIAAAGGAAYQNWAHILTSLHVLELDNFNPQ